MKASSIEQGTCYPGNGSMKVVFYKLQLHRFYNIQGL